jgi:hypothetical protein
VKTPMNQSIIKYIIFIFTQDDHSIELAGSRYEIDADNGILIIKKVIKDDHGNYRCKAFSEGKFDEKTAELRVLGMGINILVSFWTISRYHLFITPKNGMTVTSIIC